MSQSISRISLRTAGPKVSWKAASETTAMPFGLSCWNCSVKRMGTAMTAGMRWIGNTCSAIPGFLRRPPGRFWICSPGWGRSTSPFGRTDRRSGVRRWWKTCGPSTKNGGDCRPKNRFWGGNPRAGRIISPKRSLGRIFLPKLCRKSDKVEERKVEGRRAKKNPPVVPRQGTAGGFHPMERGKRPERRTKRCKNRKRYFGLVRRLECKSKGCKERFG